MCSLYLGKHQEYITERSEAIMLFILTSKLRNLSHLLHLPSYYSLGLQNDPIILWGSQLQIYIVAWGRVFSENDWGNTKFKDLFDKGTDSDSPCSLSII